jgi:hypothetical protein
MNKSILVPLAWNMSVRVVLGALSTAVCLSYFHRKSGPVIQCTSPGDFLQEADKQAILGLMDKIHIMDNFVQNAVGPDKVSLNYFFEIPSAWSQLNREKLMLSMVFAEKMLPSSQEEQIRTKALDLAQRLKENVEIFKAFYFRDRSLFHELHRKQIFAANAILRKILDEFRQSLEEKVEETPIKSSG